jgi:hypothetical protein
VIKVTNFGEDSMENPSINANIRRNLEDIATPSRDAFAAMVVAGAAGQKQLSK